MKRRTLQAWLLRTAAVLEILAFPAVIMPRAWMAGVHAWMGLGELPDAPILDYLARTVSMVYGLHGVLLWIVASDVVRYRPIIVYIGVGYWIAGVVFLCIDLNSGMPGLWTLSEVALCLGGGTLLLWTSGAPDATPKTDEEFSAPQ